MILVFGGLIDFEEKKIEIIFLIVFVSYCSFFLFFLLSRHPQNGTVNKEWTLKFEER